MTSASSAWLIESGAGTYWSGRTPADFTNDHANACRFARFDDAERVRCWVIEKANHELAMACRSSEHVWLAAAPPPPEGIAARDAVIESLPISIYRVEEDENAIRLSVAGLEIGKWGGDTPKGIALLKLDAAIRALRSPASSKDGNHA